MAQGVLPYKVEQEASPSGMTALGGLPAYLDLAKILNLAESVAEHVKARNNKQGWVDAEMVILSSKWMRANEWHGRPGSPKPPMPCADCASSIVT